MNSILITIIVCLYVHAFAGTVFPPPTVQFNAYFVIETYFVFLFVHCNVHHSINEAVKVSQPRTMIKSIYTLLGGLSCYDRLSVAGRPQHDFKRWSCRCVSVGA